MDVELNNLCPEFSSITSASYKRKVYDTCVLYAMAHYEMLKKSTKNDMFPDTKYHTLEEQLAGAKTVKKTIGPPRKKRTPVRKIPSKNVVNVDIESVDEKNKNDEKTNKKEKRKAYPIVFNKNVKTVIDFIIGRFLWEIYFIEPDTDEQCPESKQDIETYILTGISNEWERDCNISQLIIHSVNKLFPSKILSNSYELNKELRIKFDDHLENTAFSSFAAEYLTEFLKILMLFFSNRFWLEKTQTVNIKNVETILRYIEFVIPIDCKTVSHGLVDDLIQYDQIINPVKVSSKPSSNKGKSKGNTSSNETEESDEVNSNKMRGKQSKRNKKQNETSTDNEIDSEPKNNLRRTKRNKNKKTNEETEDSYYEHEEEPQYSDDAL